MKLAPLNQRITHGYFSLTASHMTTGTKATHGGLLGAVMYHTFQEVEEKI